MMTKERIAELTAHADPAIATKAAATRAAGEVAAEAARANSAGSHDRDTALRLNNDFVAAASSFALHKRELATLVAERTGGA